MRYMGSKARLSKELAPIIQSYIDKTKAIGYIEPFVGGANMIDKIRCNKRYGFDTHKYLIALLQKAQTDIRDFPDIITEEIYNEVKNNKDNYEDWLVGLVGFCSFGSKWFGGFRRSYNKDGTHKEETAGVIRNLKKQAPNLKNITFQCRDFRTIKPEKVSGYVIYCDPPYRDTTKYATDSFPYDEFYDWCRKMSKSNTVLCSEYWMPDDFKCIWEMPVKSMLNQTTPVDTVERLFIYNGI